MNHALCTVNMSPPCLRCLMPVSHLCLCQVGHSEIHSVSSCAVVRPQAWPPLAPKQLYVHTSFHRHKPVLWYVRTVLQNQQVPALLSLRQRVCEPDGSLDLMISLHMGKCDCNGCILWPVSTLQGWTDTEADLSSMSSRPASRQVSCDISKDTAEIPDFKPCNSSSFKSKLKSHDSGIFEKVTSQAERITYVASIKRM